MIKLDILLTQLGLDDHAARSPSKYFSHYTSSSSSSGNSSKVIDVIRIVFSLPHAFIIERYGKFSGKNPLDTFASEAPILASSSGSTCTLEECLFRLAICNVTLWLSYDPSILIEEKGPSLCWRFITFGWPVEHPNVLVSIFKK